MVTVLGAAGTAGRTSLATCVGHDEHEAKPGGQHAMAEQEAEEPKAARAAVPGRR